jgi:hypothetical protein
MSRKRRAALAAAGSPNPQSTLAAGTPLARKPMLQTAPPKVRRPKASGPDAATVALVLARDGDSCARCGHGLSGVRGENWSIHHRKLRSQGGNNSPANLVALCGHGTVGCHGFAHRAPKRARMEGGWILRSTDDPAAYPVAHKLHGLVFLTAAGGWSPVREVAA